MCGQSFFEYHNCYKYCLLICQSSQSEYLDTLGLETLLWQLWSNKGSEICRQYL
jgi:hypothetical protein